MPTILIVDDQGKLQPYLQEVPGVVVVGDDRLRAEEVLANEEIEFVFVHGTWPGAAGWVRGLQLSPREFPALFYSEASLRLRREHLLINRHSLPAVVAAVMATTSARAEIEERVQDILSGAERAQVCETLVSASASLFGLELQRSRKTLPEILSGLAEICAGCLTVLERERPLLTGCEAEWLAAKDSLYLLTSSLDGADNSTEVEALEADTAPLAAALANLVAKLVPS